MAKPTGTVYLCENAVIDNSYSATIDFKNAQEQLSYWAFLKKYSVSDFMYIRRTTQQIKVNYTLDHLKTINYLYFRAEEDAKLYYCFVTRKEYVSDTTTMIYFEVDVLQTYMFDYEIKQSYVLQEHVDRWTADHKPIFSRTDEGLDYGSEYTVENGYRIKDDTNIVWYLVAMKPGYNGATGDNAKENTQIGNIPNPYVYYLIPSATEEDTFINITAKDTSKNDYVEHACANILTFMKLMQWDEGSIGSYIHQIVRLPYLPFDFKVKKQGSAIYFDTRPEITRNKVDITFSYLGEDGYHFIQINSISSISNFTDTEFTNDELLFKPYHRKLAEMDLYEGLENALPTQEQWDEIKANPYTTERDKRFESKLLTYPYRYNYLHDWRNSPVIVKNEYVGGDKITVNYSQSIGFNCPARFWLSNYRKDPEGRQNSLVQLTQDDVPIVTNEYYTYLLQNRNQLQADRTNMLVKGWTNTATGVVGGAVGGLTAGAGGVIGGAILGGVTAGINAQVNYQSLIRSQNAKQQDLANYPDTIVNSNDGVFNLQDDNRYLTFYRMKICCEFEELLADTFATSGYTVKRVKVPNLRSRTRFNYIKTVGANIVGSFDQEDLQKIKAIFDNGITFWHWNATNFKPYDYSLENIETILL